MKRTLLLICCLATLFLMHAASAAAADKAKKFKDKQIEELSKKAFYYSVIDGKQSLKLTDRPEDDTDDPNSRAAQADPCENCVVKLGESGQAVPISGTSLILAFLSCPSLGFEYGSVVTLFDHNNVDAPLCFSRLDLMTETGIGRAYYYGIIESLEVRRAKDKAYHVVVFLSGADGTDHWTSFAFLRIDLKCGITILSKLYSSWHCSDVCEGSRMEYQFLDNDTVEVIEKDFVSSDQKAEKVLKTTRRNYNLTKLYKNPQSRVFGSKLEKASALAYSGDVEVRDKKGSTPLMWAAKAGSPDIVKALLDKGADINARSQDGSTALMQAAERGSSSVVRMLAEQGADVNAADDAGWTPLIWAVGHPEATEELIDKGANVNSKSTDGHTVLMWAVHAGNRDEVKMLLNKGADVNAKTEEGKTALKIAQNKGHKVIEGLLRASGATE